MGIWKNIKGYSGYQASDLGNIRSVRRNEPRILKTRLHGKYLTVQLYIDGKRVERNVHRLVAKTFIPNPENKPCVNHINGIKTDNRVENLEWATYSENTQHALSNGLKKSGQDNYNATITNEMAFWCRSVYKPRDKNFGLHALSMKLNVDVNVIRSVVHGESYKSAGGDPHPKQYRSPNVPINIREKIREIFIKGSREFGVHALSRNFNLSRKTISNIIREQHVATAED